MFSFLDSLSMFFIYSFIGWVVEVVFYGITEGKFINRGFLNGPLCPVYGLGFYGVILLLTPVENNFAVLFFGSMLVTTLIEFLAGFILDMIFHLRWWDYSKLKHNIHGYVCLQFSIYWGMACTLGMKILQPVVRWILDITDNTIQIIIVSVFAALLIIDIISTVSTIIGFKKRVKVVMNVSNEIRQVSDKIGEQIYGTVDSIVTKTTPTIESYSELKKLYDEHRTQEKELAQGNRAEEKALLDKIVASEKESIRQGRIAANKKLSDAIGTIKLPERRLISMIKPSLSDANKLAITLLLNKVNADEQKETNQKINNKLSKKSNDDSENDKDNGGKAV